MKESEFLELLNLYLDHEIGAADAARLEAEVQINAKRRAIYAQYCRMQKACKLLAVDLQAEAQPAARPVSTDKLVAFAEQRQVRAWRPGYFVAGAASLAAACVAIVFVARRERPMDVNTPQALVQAVRPAPSPTGSVNGVGKAGTEHAGARGLVSVAAAPERNGAARVTLVGSSLVLSGNHPAEAVFASAMPSGDDQLAWIRDFQLVSLQERKQLEQLRFDPAPATLRPEGRPLGVRPPADSSVELGAFRFVK